MRERFYYTFSLIGISCILIACYSWVIITPTVIANLSPTPSITIQPNTSIPTKPMITKTSIPSCYVKTNIPNGHLNLRSEPNGDSRIIAVLSEGQILYPIGRLDNGWLPVTTITGELVGYVYAEYTNYQEQAK